MKSFLLSVLLLLSEWNLRRLKKRKLRVSLREAKVLAEHKNLPLYLSLGREGRWLEVRIREQEGLVNDMKVKYGHLSSKGAP